MENGGSSVIDAVDNCHMTAIHPDIHLILGSIEVLEQVRPVV